MTMEKRKKQHNAAEDLLLSLNAGGTVSDQAYLALGSLFESGRIHQNGRDLVVVDPSIPARVRLTFRRTPLGMLAPTVLGALGVEDRLHESVLWHAQPRCSQCGSLAEKAQKIEAALWPSDGYVALVVDGIVEGFPLKEQCELLGAERAVVGGILKRVDDIEDQTGEPVVQLSAVSRAEDVSREIESWFTRGGGALRLVHFASRDAGGVHVQRVFRDWRCVPCGVTFPIATRQALETSGACPRCRGEGWLLVEDDRFVACEECDSYGCVTPIGSYELGGVCLKDLAACSTREVVHALPEVTRHPFAGLMSSAIADYPVGACADLLSKGERARCSILSAAISQIPQLSLVVDLGSVGFSEEDFKVTTPLGAESSVSIFSPTLGKAETLAPSSPSEEVVTLRDLHVGPLTIDSLSFARSGASLIQGDAGSGKSLLLGEIARRFAKRKKLAHLAAFGDLKRCHLIRCGGGSMQSLGDLLGIGEAVASEMVRLRSAQERGLVEDDFNSSRSKHLCAECSGVPSAPEEICEGCQGSLFDSHVGSVKVGDTTFAEIMRMPLVELGRVFWSNDMIVGLVERLPEAIKGLSLTTSSGELPPAARRFVEIFTPLAKSLGANGDRAPDLFLIDAPFGTSGAYQGLIISSMKDLVTRGATIVCAGAPKGLENLFGSVIRLRAVNQSAKGNALSRYFDARLARRSELCV